MDQEEKQGRRSQPNNGSAIGGLDEPFPGDDRGIVKNLLDAPDRKEEIIIDGRIFREGDRVFDLVDALEDEPHRALPEKDPNPALEAVAIEEIRAVAERIAREMIPEVVERVIREEIDKLKRGQDE